ncbi:MAG: C40 family peptidase [Bacteroidales bacterium]|nr:C40 family peptidase [Bacteroidales bacterium]
MKKFSLLFVLLSALLISACGSAQKDNSFYAISSKKLGVNLSGKENKELIKTMSEWKGTPYKYGGTSKQGVDCSGFVSSVYKEVYGKKLHRTSRDMYKYDVKKISKNNLKCGDLLFFKTSGKKVSHVGIYIADNKFIHAASKGVVINDLDESYYKKTYYKSGRVK